MAEVAGLLVLLVHQVADAALDRFAELGVLGTGRLAVREIREQRHAGHGRRVAARAPGPVGVLVHFEPAEGAHYRRFAALCSSMAAQCPGACVRTSQRENSGWNDSSGNRQRRMGGIGLGRMILEGVEHRTPCTYDGSDFRICHMPKFHHSKSVFLRLRPESKKWNVPCPVESFDRKCTRRIFPTFELLKWNVHGPNDFPGSIQKINTNEASFQRIPFRRFPAPYGGLLVWTKPIV